MTNIYKYRLDWVMEQTISCRAIKILDIQLQNGTPYIWIVTNDLDVEEVDIAIIVQGTGGYSRPEIEKFTHVSTTQSETTVFHWFTDFKGQQP